jgi:hypothetical protein
LIEHTLSGESLWFHGLLFRLGRGLSTSEAEDLLRCNLVRLVVCDGRRDELERFSALCIEYLRVHAPSTSEIMRTREVTPSNDEDLRRLCTRQQWNCHILNESVGHGKNFGEHSIGKESLSKMPRISDARSKAS